MAERLRAPVVDAPVDDLMTPGEPGYDAARAVWNGRFDSRPDVIARCRTRDEVAAAVEWARGRGLAVTVKGNGHSYAGESAASGGLLIDLEAMADVSVDPARRRAVVGPGATWGTVDAATQAHGLAVPGGTVSTVGVSGLTLGGGEGWLGRKFGLTIDNLIAAEVVTAASEIVRADADSNPDLFWAIRGGGGNFGVVTAFEFELQPFGPQLVAGQVIYPGRQAAGILRRFRDFFATAPDEATGWAFFLRIPPIPAFPTELHGELVIDLALAYLGPVEDGERILAPLRSLGEPIVDTVGPVSYVELQQAFDAGAAPGNRWYTRGHYLDALTDAAIDTLVAALDPFPGELTLVYTGPGGGAIGRVAGDATAYAGRSAAYGLHIWPGWLEASHDEAVMAWARRVHDAMAPHANGGAYVNLLGEDEDDRVRAVYGPNFDRLVRLKARWDPENLFRSNHNIAPA